MELWNRFKQGVSVMRSGLPKTSAALHEAASTGRRLKGWTPTGQNLNSIAKASGGELVKRSRNLVQTNGYAVSGQESFAANLVGTGIKPSSTVDDTSTRESIQQLWARWLSQADADGQTTFYGLQTIISAALFEAGEVFARLRPRRMEDGLSVPLQIQLLEAEQLDRTYSQQRANGNTIRCGIEFNRLGKRVAYWFWRQHPGDSTFPTSYNERVRVPAQHVLHIYEVKRPGQIRGLPRMVPALVKMFLLDQYDDAELDRKKVAALIAAWITKPDEGSFFTTEVEQNGTAPDGSTLTEAIAEWQPGSVGELLPGEDIKFSDPADVGGSYEAFQYRNLLGIAAALGQPYTNVSGDMLKANYSNTRAALLEFRRRITPMQHSIIVHQFCRPVWARWNQAALLSGALVGDLDDLVDNVKWIPPRWEWVDPKKDREAEKLAVDAGFKSLSDVQEEEGYDPEAVAKRRRADKDRAQRYGLATAPPGHIPPSQEEPENKQPDENAPDQPQEEAAHVLHAGSREAV